MHDGEGKQPQSQRTTSSGRFKINRTIADRGKAETIEIALRRRAQSWLLCLQEREASQSCGDPPLAPPGLQACRSAVNGLAAEAACS